MDEENKRHFNLRVDGDILAKFRYVSGYYGRSANKQLVWLMQKAIASYEKEHGEIDINDCPKGKSAK